ncbi:MAG: hypothetical protein R3B57_07315 [Phycisphaerales bacterium]
MLPLRIRRCVPGMVCVVLALAAGRVMAQEGGADKARALEQAVMSKNLRGVERALDDLWNSDREKAREMAWTLLTQGPEDQRPIALASFVTHASVEELSQLANADALRREEGARVMLVRALGTRPGAETIAEARKFLRDSSRLVRAAAVEALADLGDVGSIALYYRKMTSVPSQVVNWKDDDAQIEQMAMYGAVSALTDLRPEHASEVQLWIKEHAKDIDSFTPPPPPEERTGEWTYWDNDTLSTPSFEVQFELGNTADAGAMQGRSGWEEISKGLEQSAAAARRAAEPIFGKIHLPPVRLVLANDQTISKFGGPSRGYAGFASGNKIVMRFENWGAAQRTLVHEYVHIIHSAYQTDQPRWLSEGLAESLSKSPTSSAWAGIGASRAASLGEALNKGLVSETLRWDRSGSSNEPPELYAQGHAVVDYLRFGPFTAPEARLRDLMARISKGQRPQQAIETLYGPVRDLDEGIRRWIQGD